MRDQPSATAQGVALRRAAHQILDRPRVFEDELALRIVGPAEAAALRKDAAGLEGNRPSSALRAFIAVRSRVAELELANAVGRGVRQYVVLGAGLDTFAYRNPYPELRVFEVDHPATQEWKRWRLDEGSIAIPANLTFAAIDFESQPLVEVLRAAGLDATRPSFFSWLGVTPYLERDVVLETLGAIAPLAAGGGGVVFDYSGPADSLSPHERAALDLLAARVRAAGEPFRGSLEPARLAADLLGMGFRSVTDVGPDELNARHFAGRTDGLRVRGSGRIITALV
jgi:methyltransferase (TIGR00027 family)